MEKCPTSEMIVAHASGEDANGNPLADDVAAEIAAHLEVCDSCTVEVHAVRKSIKDFSYHTHVLCGACGKKDYPCYLKVCYEIGVVGLERDCPSCEEGYRLSDAE